MHAGFFFIVGWTSDYDPRKEAPETSRWRSKVKMNIYIQCIIQIKSNRIKCIIHHFIKKVLHVFMTDNLSMVTDIYWYLVIYFCTVNKENGHTVYTYKCKYLASHAPGNRSYDISFMLTYSMC